MGGGAHVEIQWYDREVMEKVRAATTANLHRVGAYMQRYIKQSFGSAPPIPSGIRTQRGLLTKHARKTLREVQAKRRRETFESFWNEGITWLG